MTKDADIIIVGGGLAGLAAAASLARLGHDIIHLAPKAPPDKRTSALMMPSVDFLRKSGLVDDPASLGHALTSIRIIDATPRLIRAPETFFDADEIGLSAFGWNFGNEALLARFQSAAPADRIETRNIAVTDYSPEGNLGAVTLADDHVLRAPLIVGADGKKSLIRTKAGITTSEHHFDQSALVCDLELTRPIGGTSVEFHYPNGPFTLVPAGGNKANLVWIDEDSVLRQTQSGGLEALIAAFNEKSQRLFGGIKLISPSFIFPLSVLSVTHAGTNGAALVGESAHAFPPIGAQGLNLGLRDVSDLLDAVQAADTAHADWGISASEDYSKRRSSDLARTGLFVETLFRSLLADILPSQTLRAGGLWALKLVPALRKQAFALGMGER